MTITSYIYKTQAPGSSCPGGLLLTDISLMKYKPAISNKPSNRSMPDSQESADAFQMAHFHDNEKAEIIAPTAIFLTIAYTAVLLRYKSRRLARLTLEADDWCIGIGLVRAF